MNSATEILNGILKKEPFGCWSAQIWIALFGLRVESVGFRVGFGVD